MSKKNIRCELCGYIGVVRLVRCQVDRWHRVCAGCAGLFKCLRG